MAMNTDNQEALVQSDIETLLPWHAAGTLSRRDAQRVEEALERYPELARRYALVREELGETIHLNETLGAPSARAMEKLFAAIDAEPKRLRAPSLNLGERISEFFASLSPRTLAWSASAAALAILLQAGFLAGIVLKEHATGGYETASTTSPASHEGSFALIRFQPQASASDVTKFLEANKMVIAGGPSAGGLYRVRIADSKLAKEERDGLVKKLQGDKVISFIATTE
jgi:anti-sigma factor RsiW